MTISKEEPKAKWEHELREDLELTRPYFQNLVSGLRDGIREGRWSAILADDASGRIPSHILSRVMDRVAESVRKEKAKLFFVAGGRGAVERKPAIEEYLATIRPNLGDRVLVVTEHIASGKSLEAIGEALHAQGIPFDVATLSMQYNRDYMRERGSKAFRDARVFSGRADTQHILMYDGWIGGAAGVSKDPQGGALAQRKSSMVGLEGIARRLADEEGDRLYELIVAEKEKAK